MTDYSISPTLDAAVARCRLPITVGYFTTIDDDVLSDGFAVDSLAVPVGAWRDTPAEARAAYLNLVASLSLEGTAADVAVSGSR